MGTSDWFTKKLGSPEQTQAPPPSSGYQPVQSPQAAPPQAAPQAQPQASPSGTPASMSEALHDPNLKTQGGPATRTERQNCPGCGSRNYFSRSNAEQAKPRCYDCGYPVIQYGSQLGEGGSQL